MKEVSETALTHVMAAHPGARIEERDGSRVVLIPMYDIATDAAWTEERKIVSDPDATQMGILPVLNVRKGAQFNPNGEARVSPLGHIYRIVGWSPPSEGEED